MTLPVGPPNGEWVMTIRHESRRGEAQVVTYTVFQIAFTIGDVTGGEETDFLSTEIGNFDSLT